MTDDKKLTKIAKSFSRSSRSYDNAARLQRFSGKQIMPWLPTKNNLRVLDLGCGTGFFTELLAEHYEDVTGVDISPEMLNYASQAREKNFTLVRADAFNLPFADSSFDLVYSNLVLQWCKPLESAITEIMRVLKPGGNLVFTTLTDGTLCELKSAWQQVDNDQHVNDFLTEVEVDDALLVSHASIVESMQTDVCLDYENPLHLAHELKGLGANHVANKNKKGLGGKSSWKAMNFAYQRLFEREDGTYPATYSLYKIMAAKLND